jgi:tetratricopeptide (TPR) repeat protein
LQITWRPEVITFYTAKRTRWGLDGLETIRAREVGVLDGALAVVRGFEVASLGRDWFTKDPDALIQKVASYMIDLGVTRDSHLLILDNTETMAQDAGDVTSLVHQMQELSRKVGRVLVTSRRREAIEARQIEIKPLSDDEAVEFLRKRAKFLNRQAAMQAGLATLRGFARRLGNKPLVLEVFMQALGEPGISLQRAFDRVLRMQRQDLGEFLYSDAWNRMSEGMKHLLLLMTQVSDVHDEMLLKLCCMKAQVTVIEASDAIEESRGIASVSRIGGRLQVVFSPEFMRFCGGRTITIAGAAQPTAVSVYDVKKRYRDFLRSTTVKVSDRVDRAYRHALARAAWQAFQDGRLDDCELFYDEAIVADSANGWLFDRYAYFLLTQQRLEEALDKATKATQLISDDPDSWFTRGMVEARLGRTQVALTSLNWSLKNGKPLHLVRLQMAYAYLNDNPPDYARARACLDESERSVSASDAFRLKTLSEIRRVRERNLL